MKLLIIILIIAAFSAGYIASELVVTAQAGHDRKFEVVEVEVTAYSPSKHITQGNPFQMASGRIAKPSELDELEFIAVSRDLMSEYNLKWEDTVWVAFTVEDTMNKRIENGVDLFLRNQDLAKKFGRQSRTIIIERR